MAAHHSLPKRGPQLGALFWQGCSLFWLSGQYPLGDAWLREVTMHPWHSVLAFGSLFPKCMPLAFERTYPASWDLSRSHVPKAGWSHGPRCKVIPHRHARLSLSLSLSLFLSLGLGAQGFSPMPARRRRPQLVGGCMWEKLATTRPVLLVSLQPQLNEGNGNRNRNQATGKGLPEPQPRKHNPKRVHSPASREMKVEALGS